MPGPDLDLVILGGGCAGLALASRLAGEPLRAALVEPREDYADDRRWSFWRPADAPAALAPGMGASVAGRWSRWSVDQDGARATTRTSRARVYETVAAGPYAEATLERIDAAPGIERLSGHRAGAVSPRPGGGWQIETTAGPLAARRVVDTRPPAAAPAYGQFFEGAEIAVDGAVFDPETVGLMSFRPQGAPGAVDFVYTLPFARDRALVEVTRFGPEKPGPGALSGWLEAEIARAADGRAVMVERRERGALPMDVSHASPGPPGSHVRLGLGGGSARPSTGYAFARIQAGAESLARQIAAGRTELAPPADGPATRWMDALFLRVLARSAERGPGIFLSLFRRAPRDRVERFLSGSTRASDRLAVIAAMPPGPFLAALAAGEASPAAGAGVLARTGAPRA
jgi:lycopene beta-cyclase